MVALNSLIDSVKPSPTFAASQRAARLRAQGREIISLTVGEPDFDTPQHVKDAAIDAMRRGFTKYTATEGIPILRQRISEKLKRDQGLDYPESQIVVTNGGKQAIATAFAVLLNPGDEVIIPAPYWTSYPDMAFLAGGKPVIVETRAADGYLMRPADLIRACTARTKMIVLNSPSNPTGAAYSKGDLEALGDAISSLKNASEITVLCDEIYEYFVYDGFQHHSFASVVPSLRENTLIVNGFSKAYAMTGWRAGYVAGPRRVTDAIATHQSQFTSNVCSITQYAAAAAYDDQGAFPRQMVAEFSTRLDVIGNALKGMSDKVGIPVRPRGAFYVFLRLDNLIGRKAGDTEIRCAADFCDYLLDRFDVALVTGEAFGDAKAARLSFAAKRELIEKAMARIGEAASSLR